MSLRAPDVKDEHGWQIVDDEDNVVGYATSRDKAREGAKNGHGYEPLMGTPTPATVQWRAGLAQNGEVLPPDDSPEAVAGREAWELHQRLKAVTLALKYAWVKQAELLYTIYQDKTWERLGDGGFDSWESYLADPDTDIEYRWAMNLVAIYRQLVVERGLDPKRLEKLEVSKVTLALPAVRRDLVSLNEAVADCESLTKSALKLKLSGRASESPGRPDTGTSISTESEPEWAVCPTCKRRGQVDSSGEWT